MFEENPLEPSPFVFDSNDLSAFTELDNFNASSSSRQQSPLVPTIIDSYSDLNNLCPDSGSTSISGDLSPSFAIDPQLMATPTTSKSPSEFGDDDATKEEHRREEDDDDDDGPVTPPPVKPGNKSKDRKPVVHSGGVQKKVHISSVVKLDPFDNTMDDWRPTAEEYQRMSSKEKRQLRNKISARNFRNRRREYITTLESDVAERDRLIDAIHAELGSTKSENAALQQEIKALKKSLLSASGRTGSPVLPPPGPLPISTPSPLVTPNTHKDLAATASPRLAAKAFWGGSSTTFGGITPVHTVTIPDLLVGAAIKPTLQENINPSLNTNTPINTPAPFDTFTDANPFTMKMLDAYRMQLWTRMAQQQHQHAITSQQQQQQQQQQQSASPSPPPLTGLAAGLRPHYFSSTSSMRNPAAAHSLSPLSGKHHGLSYSATSTSTSAASAYPTPPSSPQLGSTSTTSAPSPQHAALATMASQTLMQRLGSAFWQAFSGSSSIARVPAWDADKVRRVLEGTAVVRVVDVEPPPSSSSTQTQAGQQPACVKLGACVRETGLGVLEESMRALTLSKK
ncbi:hypothetical protein B0F90DRAFT_1809738 [Multifurca ochricompacta]|uniref:BZIP domain-containing protein n=1 Tax=Multifurca ochricompacta TaxID=376703 RepID=A0AAD4M5R8_9AGAM|nr:hypothetical protein B0F90DRAFT_1809738 [Multifurca ochricompacta]